MGTWGFGILSDDTALDIHSDYIGFFNQGQSHPQILKRLKSDYKADLKDQDMRVNFWFAVAAARWKCGVLDDKTLAEVKKIIDTEQWKRAWEGESEAKIVKRQQAVKSFWTKLQTANPKPITPKKPIQRKPIYQPGDCLAVKLQDGDYAAAIVLNKPSNTYPSRTGETYGTNLIGLLRYKSPAKPTMDVFERRDWLPHDFVVRRDDLLCVYRVSCLRYRKYKDRFEVVERTVIRESDPKDGHTFSGWTFAEEMFRHDRRQREGVTTPQWILWPRPQPLE